MSLTWTWPAFAHALKKVVNNAGLHCAPGLTVTQPSAYGDLRLYPSGSALPATSSINYGPGQTRANNAIVSLGPAGDLTVRCVQISGTVHLILDINGYFE